MTGLVTAPTTPLGDEIAPASGTSLLFIPEAGGQAHIVETGPDGHYSVDLGAGTYEARLEAYGPSFYDRAHPGTYGRWPKVTVSAGHETRLDFIYQSG